MHRTHTKSLKPKGPTPCPLKRPQDETGATKIAATEATAWLNRGAESIATLNLGFRRSWRDEDRGTELTRRRRRGRAGATETTRQS